MKKILFVCHGNICRSTMAEFVFNDMVVKSGCADKFMIASAATSTEEIGNPVHPGTRRILNDLGINCSGKTAIQMKRGDYEKYDYLIGMDSMNIRNMMRILGNDPEQKVSRLLDFTNQTGDIADPWYTGDFDATYRDVEAGCRALLDKLTKEVQEPWQ